MDYSYDALNRLNLKTLTTDSPIYTNYLYKTSDRNGENQSKYRTTQLGGEIIDETSYSYTYNAVGNITKITTSTRANPNTSETAIGTRKNYRSYEYDDLSQLTRENNETGKKTKVWNYDALGNIESVKIFNYNNTTATSDLGKCPSAINYVYTDEGKDGWNRLLTSVEYKTRNTKGALEITKSQTISYDAIGNPVEYLDHDMRWFGRQLQTVNVGANTTDTTDDKTLSFTYGADGLRGTKTVTTGGNTVKSEYYYLNGLLAYEKRGTEELYFFYDSMGHLTSIRHFTNNANDNRYIYYVTTNSMGDVIGIYNSAGELKASYEYDAWGNVIAITDASGNAITDETHIAHINPIRYRGYYYDTETKLYYLQSRYYDPAIGRFISADDRISDKNSLLELNLFAYCTNNPIAFSDPTGHSVTVGVLAGLGAVIGIGKVLSAIKVAATVIGLLGIGTAAGLATIEISDALQQRSQAKEQAAAKADTKIKETVKPDSKDRYWKATKSGGIVNITDPISFDEAVTEVASGGNVFTVTSAEAYTVAFVAGGDAKPTQPENHGEGILGYYDHYHTHNHGKGHVWYLF